MTNRGWDLGQLRERIEYPVLRRVSPARIAKSGPARPRTVLLKETPIRRLKKKLRTEDLTVNHSEVERRTRKGRGKGEENEKPSKQTRHCCRRARKTLCMCAVTKTVSGPRFKADGRAETLRRSIMQRDKTKR